MLTERVDSSRQNDITYIIGVRPRGRALLVSTASGLRRRKRFARHGDGRTGPHSGRFIANRKES